MKRLHSPVQLGLLGLLCIALLAPLLGLAPNRLLSAQGLYLPGLLHGSDWLWLLALLPPLAAPWRRQGGRLHLWLLLAVVLLDFAMLRLAGRTARLLTPDDEALGRVSFGAGFWLLQLYAVLQLSESLRQLELSRPLRWLAALLLCLPLVWLLSSGQCDQLSLLREYRNQADTFDQALWRHLALVLFSVLPATLLGIGLGLGCYFRPRLESGLFAVLNVVQTIPSIALFGLLIAPLAIIGHWWPASGIAGIGMTPALLALMLYALLPVTHGTLAAMRQVPAAARESARGIGMSDWQIFARVELPLGLPVWLSGLRVTTVQAVGLAAVAALIGAGGFGAILFQGLSASAIDQVLLGVLPIVLLTMAVDATFQVVISLIEVPTHD